MPDINNPTRLEIYGVWKGCLYFCGYCFVFVCVKRCDGTVVCVCLSVCLRIVILAIDT
jgi:hypothetical protein